MNKLKGIGNNIIQISEVQDGRFWIHSFELGFGKWITNKELLDLIKSKRSPTKTTKKSSRWGRGYATRDSEDKE